MKRAYRVGLFLSIGMGLSGCSKKEQPSPAASNVVSDLMTGYVESRVQALDHAKMTADRAQEVIQRQQRQVDTASQQ